MANPEHLNVFVQGYEAWNVWREAHPQVVPDLSGADLRGLPLQDMDLRGVNFSRADLRGASFLESDLSGADLTCARLDRADVHGVSFKGTNLEGVSFLGTQIGGANFSEAVNLDAEAIELSHWCGGKIPATVSEEVMVRLFGHS